MKVLTIETIIKPMKLKSLTHGFAELDGRKLEINLDQLYVTFGDDSFELARIPGTKGGYRYFFLCPDCGRRCRKLYSYSSAWYACSKCQEVHKQTLNRTKTDCQYYWGLAIREARKLDPKFEPRKGYVDYGDFPKRPKWMKHHKYMKHWIRFNRYLDKGIKLWLR
ncbi:hypothetical protein [Streptococcus pluranimalium]|uniref:hypothetical protein n=1 Tax=Streptococcus pluranimalium TaxID=82348 RepID=UPI003F66DE1B